MKSVVRNLGSPCLLLACSMAWAHEIQPDRILTSAVGEHAFSAEMVGYLKHARLYDLSTGEFCVRRFPEARFEATDLSDRARREVRIFLDHRRLDVYLYPREVTAYRRLGQVPQPNGESSLERYPFSASASQELLSRGFLRPMDLNARENNLKLRQLSEATRAELGRVFGPCFKPAGAPVLTAAAEILVPAAKGSIEHFAARDRAVYAGALARDWPPETIVQDLPLSQAARHGLTLNRIFTVGQLLQRHPKGFRAMYRLGPGSLGQIERFVTGSDPFHALAPIDPKLVLALLQLGYTNWDQLRPWTKTHLLASLHASVFERAMPYFDASAGDTCELSLIVGRGDGESGI